jgi:hypothetical protein
MCIAVSQVIGWVLTVRQDFDADKWELYTLKLHEYTVASATPVPVGKYQLSVQFNPTGVSKQPAYYTGDVVFSVDGKPLGQLKDIKVAGQYSAVTGYGLQIGRNTATPVSHSYKVPFALTDNWRTSRSICCR